MFRWRVVPKVQSLFLFFFHFLSTSVGSLVTRLVAQWPSANLSLRPLEIMTRGRRGESMLSSLCSHISYHLCISQWPCSASRVWQMCRLSWLCINNLLLSLFLGMGTLFIALWFFFLRDWKYYDFIGFTGLYSSPDRLLKIFLEGACWHRHWVAWCHCSTKSERHKRRNCWVWDK